MKVFISWSGERSKAIALAWERLLKDVLQHCVPFMSKSGIEPGEVWFNVLADELRDTHFGIFCLTPENQNARWILFEAGAVSKHVERARICPYLFDMSATDVEFPLEAFNASRADKDGTFGIVKSINNAIESHRLSELDLNRAFEKWWPDFEAQLAAARKIAVKTPDRRTDRNMIQELVDLSRANTKTVGVMNQMLHRAFPSTPHYEGPRHRFMAIRIRFIGGPRDGEIIEGPPQWNMNSLNFEQAGFYYEVTGGEVGGICNSASMLSILTRGSMSHAAHRRLIDEQPEIYGVQAYQVVDREEDGPTLKLTMQFVPHEKGKEANEFQRRMNEERERKAGEGSKGGNQS